MTTFDAELDNGMEGPSWTIWLTAATLLVFLVWAAFAWIDEIVRAEGEIVSSSRPQIIQNLEGGILAEMLVRQGDTVQPGDILAKLQSTQFQTAVDDLGEQITSLEIKRLRLEAEIDGAFDFKVPPHLAHASFDIITSERALLSARQSDYVSRTDGARKVLGQTQKELSLLENLLDRNIVSLIEVTRARKTHGDAEIKYNEIVTRAELDRANEYSETLKELATLRQNLKVSQDQLNRSIITSPMRGVVNSVSVTTIGGVVRPGEEIFQIIPLDEELFVEARVKPEDIANIKRGQQATVKLSAYDYTIYGSLKGSVKVISADTFKDERKPDGDAHYKVTLAVDLTELTDRQSNVEIRPGMQAQVELHTGEKTVLQYLTKPLYKSREAFHEP